ncbi:hypothetical protein IW140_005142 [Coemansia sp. RSA 1813]|nr:hypothetical protein EV178_005120 [Coemansia sp. RSA 1646]KAJ1766811.1 hypothetical protein LPJ74_005690 [Coemansia sp. RSA 1843]KAJ2088022.1 hypothetical protein IW138_004530 [Coemansia sp. RSA 986]KAJ2211959.1 hypothetical protein EV179_005066 [Coemansia sp. RSA 487]KAJ2565860.1 hypothetical protein IW140_005142 [Coemansia sp. RSA 1813]
MKQRKPSDEIRVIKGVDHNVYHIDGVPVHFPFKPYMSQLGMMNHMIRTLSRSQNSMLESPTGSGKSLAMLCAALGWRKNFAAKLQQSRVNVRRIATRFSLQNKSLPSHAGKEPMNSNYADKSLRAISIIAEHILKKAANGKIPSGLDQSDIDILSDYQQNYAHIKHAPVIYFGSRTHKQVSQLISELRDKTPYRMKMAVLGSRQLECIHPWVQKASSSVDEVCSELRIDNKCKYHTSSRLLLSDESIMKGGSNEIWDIEDIVSLGKSAGACPYYASHELAKAAVLVFCPYNYIVDPIVRSAVRIFPDNNVVILDEAHNIEGVARDAASVEITDVQLKRIVRECEQALIVTTSQSTYRRVIVMAKRLLLWLQGTSNKYEFSDATGHTSVWPKKDVSLDSALEEIGFTKESVTQLEFDYRVLEEDTKNPDLVNKKITRHQAQDQDQESLRYHLSGMSLRVILSLALVLKRICPANSQFKEDYRLARIKKFTNDNCSEESDPDWQSTTSTFALWAMSPGIIFSELSEKCRSIILTSGTLSPLSSYASELRTEFASTLEADHVVSPDRFLAMCIQCGPAGQLLEGKYANVDYQSYQDDIGQAVASIAAKCSGGMLVFAPSYSLLNKLIARWRETGEMAKINKHKKPFIELQGDSAHSFNRLLSAYKKFLSDRSNNSTEGQCGAVMFAVYRGKISEGIDFSDHLCRTIVNIGIPYPAFMDPKVALKREYNDAHSSLSSKSGGLLSGFSWYNTQAFRAINQALGRCLRHKSDWGAIILLDSRLAMPRNTSQLSKWIRAHIKSYSKFDQAAQDLDLFYKTRLQEDIEDSLVSNTARLTLS